MKKLVAFIAMSAILFGMALTTSAETYEVERGDNLWRIAQEYDTTVANLMEINNLDSIIIHPKQLLQIYKNYFVKRGDTLSEIGQEFNVTVEQLQEWNSLSSDLIIIGQKLTIKETNTLSKIDTVSNQTTTNSKQRKSVSASARGNTNTKPSQNNQSVNSPQGRTLSVVATAYTAECDGCSGITYTGINLNNDRHAKVIAVDPSVIPLGSEVYVEGYGYAIAGDIGGAIKGNRIDIHVPTKTEAYNWGVRNVKVTVLK